MLTLVPWRGPAIVGTSQSASLRRSRATPPSAAAEMAAFIDDANYAFPALHLTRADVTLVHRGVVPAVVGRSDVPDLKPSHDILDHAADGVDGALSRWSAQSTRPRGAWPSRSRVSSPAVSTAACPPSRTATTTLPGAGIADHEALAIETARGIDLDVPLPVIRHLIGLYAEARAAHHQADAASVPTSADPWRAGVATLGAEVAPRHPARDGASPGRHRRPPHRPRLGKAAARRRRRRMCTDCRRGTRLGRDTRPPRRSPRSGRIYEVGGGSGIEDCRIRD